MLPNKKNMYAITIITIVFSNKTLLFLFLTSLYHHLPLCFHLSLSLSHFRWPFKGYPPTHRRRPLLRLHQRQLHRCKWKRIECYYWLPTKPTKPHSLARMSGLYTFIASSNHPSCHRLCIQPLRTHICATYRTRVFLWCPSLLSFSCVYPHIHSVLQYPHAATSNHICVTDS